MVLTNGVFIQVNIIDDKEMLRIGKEYKGKDYATDVLTFNYSLDKDYNVILLFHQHHQIII